MPSKKKTASLKRPAARTRKPATERATRARPSATANALPAIGEHYAGGIFIGRFFVGTQPYALIGAPKADGQIGDQHYHSAYDRIAGADSYYDGMANTEAMAKAGSKAAQWARGLRIGGGKDWYIPSRGEALLAMTAKIAGPEAFEKRWYWTSTQHAAYAGYAWIQFFVDGYQDFNFKDYRYLVRAVRRVPI